MSEGLKILKNHLEMTKFGTVLALSLSLSLSLLHTCIVVFNFKDHDIPFSSLNAACMSSWPAQNSIHWLRIYHVALRHGEPKVRRFNIAAHAAIREVIYEKDHFMQLQCPGGVACPYRLPH